MVKKSVGVKSIAECIGCKAKFQLDASNVVKKEFEAQDGNHIWITFYDCPECGRRHCVQADNNETNDLLVGYTKQMGRLALLHRNGKSGSKKQRQKLAKTKRYLAEMRHKLMAQYQDEELVDCYGNTMKVVFVQ